MEAASLVPRTATTALTRRWRIAPLLAISLLHTTGCTALPRGEPLAGPPLPLDPPLHKRVLQGVIPLGRIAWVGNDRVVFPGIRQGTEGDRDKQVDLYLWSLQGAARRLLPRAENPCAHADRIHAWQYQPTPGGRYPFERRPVELSGPDFRARTVPPGAGWPMVDDDNTCSRVLIPDPLRDHIWKLLSRGDGFLDLGPNDHRSHRQEPVVHVDAAQRRRDTGLRLDQTTMLKVSPTAWDGSYLLYDFNPGPEGLRHWQKRNRFTIWHLDARFRARPLAVPAGPWVNERSDSIQFFPSRAGLLITSNNFARGGGPGEAGAYLLPPRGRPLRLERGLVAEPALSPDGCRLAYSHTLHLAAPLTQAQQRLVVVDLCAPGTPASAR